MKRKFLFFVIVMIFSESCSLLSGVKDEVDPSALVPKALSKPLTEKTVTDAGTETGIEKDGKKLKFVSCWRVLFFYLVIANR